MFKSSYKWLTLNFSMLLFLLTLILFTSKSLYNYPVALMAILGLFCFFKAPLQIWRDPTIRVYILLFLCLWLPLLISFPDAVNSDRSFRTVFPYLRFLFMGIFVIYVINRIETLKKLTLYVFCIMVFWCIDAIIQYVFKFDLFGHPYTPGYITGIFYPEITIGHITAALSPLYFETIRTYSNKKRWMWILFIPLFVVVLLSGRRAAWIMLSVSTIGYTYYYLKLNSFDLKVIRKISGAGVIVFVSLFLVIASNPSLQKRIDVTTNIFSGDYELTNSAIGKRLHLWQTSISIFSDNWLNGVGPRGYRYVYEDYSSDDNYFHKTGQTHPHQLVLEVLVETGILGFSGLLLFVFLFYRFIRDKDLAISLFPCALTLIIVLFPVNTHMAFYGSYWSSIFWWLMAITFATANIQLMGNTDVDKNSRK